MGPWGWSFVAAFTGGAILAFAKQLTPLWWVGAVLSVLAEGAMTALSVH
jgi:hypothetical protein